MDMAVDTTEASALLMPTPTLWLKLNPKLKPKLKLSHGTDMVMVLTHTPMADTDTHTPMEVTTISERDLLMPNPTMVMEVMVDTDTMVAKRDPLSHTTDMVVTDDMAVMDTAVDTVTDMADKKLSSLHYLNF